MKNNSIILRLLKTIKQFYPIMFPLTIICIIFNAMISSIPTIFMQNIIALVEDNWKMVLGITLVIKSFFMLQSWQLSIFYH